MQLRPSITLVSTLALGLLAAREARPQGERPLVELVVETGTPLRVALLDRIRLQRVGQPLTGTLVEAIYAYDRIVVPAGTTVLGHVKALTGVSGGARASAMLNGYFTPLRRATLEFDSLVFDDGRVLPLRTEVTSAIERLVLKTKADPGKNLAQRAIDDLAAQVKGPLSAVKQPGRGRRLQQGFVSSLPYHPQYLAAGTVYTAVLQAPLSFGTAEATEYAATGTRAPADSVLHARLLTTLDSKATPRGTPVLARVTEPLFSTDHRLILPEGTLLKGEVTFAKPARGFRKNGQLRFLFDTVQPPERDPEVLRASLYSVQVGKDERVALDDEGGASITNSKSRFVAPALATLALVGTTHQTVDYNTDGLGPETQYGTTGSRGLGGFFGFSLVGAALAQLSHPVAVAFAVVGVVRTLFGSVFAKGRDVAFPTHTQMEVQLAAEPDETP